MKLALELLGPPRLMGARRRCQLRTGSLSIGRSPGADWVIPDSERTISRLHLRIDAAHGDFLLTDLSVNGVFVNGSQASVGYGASVKLRDGDQVQVGEAQIAVSLGADAAEPPAPFELDADAFLSELVAGRDTRDPLGGPFGAVGTSPRAPPATSPGPTSASRGAVDANWMVEPIGAGPTARQASAVPGPEVGAPSPLRRPTWVDRVAPDRERSLLDLIADRPDLTAREIAAAVEDAAGLLEPSARSAFLARVASAIAGHR